MASEKQLIYKDDARKAVLRANPAITYCIDSVKPVDAVEVVHGRWEDDHGDNVCSVCKAVYDDEIRFMNRDCEFKDLPYCPSCGAKMDGKSV